MAFLKGNAGGAVMALGAALKTAQGNGDVSSQARWADGCQEMWRR